MQVSVFAVIKNFQNRAGKSEFLLSCDTFLIKKDQMKVSFSFIQNFHHKNTRKYQI